MPACCGASWAVEFCMLTQLLWGLLLRAMIDSQVDLACALTRHCNVLFVWGQGVLVAQACATMMMVSTEVVSGSQAQDS